MNCEPAHKEQNSEPSQFLCDDKLHIHQLSRDLKLYYSKIIERKQTTTKTKPKQKKPSKQKNPKPNNTAS